MYSQRFGVVGGEDMFYMSKKKYDEQMNKLYNNFTSNMNRIEEELQSARNEVSTLKELLNESNRVIEERFEKQISLISDNHAVEMQKLEAMHFWINQNLKKKMYAISCEESARFIIENMIKTPTFQNNLELLSYALKNVTVDGQYLEFGVYQGRSINHIAKEIKGKSIAGFDSFEGLPEDWTSEFEKGHFAVDKLPEVEENVTLVKGFFCDTLPDFVKEHNEDVAFMHIDSDLYSSAMDIFHSFRELIVPGTIIVFDEFFNYPDWKNGEYKALMEFVETTGAKFEYIGYVETHEQVAIRMK